MRKYRGIMAISITTLAVAMSLFQIYTGGYQALAAQWQRLGERLKEVAA